MEKNSMMVVDMEAAIAEVVAKLEGFEERVPNVLTKTLNETAKSAQKDLAKQAQKVYAVKNAGFEKSMRIKRATKSDATAILYTKGERLDLYKFNVTPARYDPHKRPSYGVKARVLNSNPQKQLLRPSDDLKSFIVKFKNEHVAVAQRKPESQMFKSKLHKAVYHLVRKLDPTIERKDNKIRSLYGPSIPHMIGNVDKVYGVVEPDLQKFLMDHVQNQIQRELHYQEYLKNK